MQALTCNKTVQSEEHQTKLTKSNQVNASLYVTGLSRAEGRHFTTPTSIGAEQICPIYGMKSGLTLCINTTTGSL